MNWFTSQANQAEIVDRNIVQEAPHRRSLTSCSEDSENLNKDIPIQSANLDENLVKKEQEIKNMETFQFPRIEELQGQIRFLKSLTELEQYLNGISQKKFKRNIRQLYRVMAKPTIGCVRYLQLVCKYCSAMFSLSRKNSELVLMGHRLNHAHEPQTCQATVEVAVMSLIRDHSMPNGSLMKGLKDQATKKFNISYFLFRKLANKFLDEKLRSFDFLQESLKSEGYQLIYEQSKERNGKYPEILVAVTQNMKKNYKKYSDMVSFDITDNLLKNISSEQCKYRVGVFCVLDTNFRILMAGIAIIFRQTKIDISKVFEFFIKIHNQAPQTIITNEQLVMTNAISKLQQRGIFRGVHIYDPWNVIWNLRKKLLGSDAWKKELMTSFKAAIYSRSTFEHQRALRVLTDDKKNEILINKFMEMARNVNYLDIPITFLGTHRFRFGKIRDIIKRHIPTDTKILRFLKKIRNLDDKLTEKSEKSYVIFEERQEDLVKDYKLGEVRLQIEKKIFYRFMENYFKSWHESTLVEQAQNSVDMSNRFVIEDKLSKSRFYIQDWNCSCDELQKTGIPCHHLLLCARMDAQKSYLDFIHHRWIKAIPNSIKMSIKWTRRGISSRNRKQHNIKN